MPATNQQRKQKWWLVTEGDLPNTLLKQGKQEPPQAPAHPCAWFHWLYWASKQKLGGYFHFMSTSDRFSNYLFLFHYMHVITSVLGECWHGNLVFLGKCYLLLWCDGLATLHGDKSEWASEGYRTKIKFTSARKPIGILYSKALLDNYWGVT